MSLNGSSNISSSNASPEPPTLTAEEIAKLVNLGPDFAVALDSVPYSEDDPVLILHYLMFNEDQKNTIVTYLLAKGAELVGTSGNAFKFDTLEDLWKVSKSMRYEHPWAFYTNYDHVANTLHISRLQTARSVIIKIISPPRRYEKIEDIQFFEY